MTAATIEWAGGIPGHIAMIDQTLLPGRLEVIAVRDIEDLRKDIRRLAIRGAPAIGLAACFGVVLGVQDFTGSRKEFDREFGRVADFLATSRPTAVNLFWGIERMRTVLARCPDATPEELKVKLLAEARLALDEDREICRTMGMLGQTLIGDGEAALTHCNAGALATGAYGTALSVFFAAKDEGKKIRVYADETRPLLQGARLTSWELEQAGIDVTLICDNMAGQIMKERRIQAVFVGSDRVAANGDAANKIGTYSVSVLAKAHNIPFYVVAPLSTIDLAVPNGDAIPIEQRDADEVRRFGGIPTAPSTVDVYNPAFDVTPAENITALVTEKGIVHEPMRKKIKALFERED
jgi:methylthioribose-1-phosphate isomerase